MALWECRRYQRSGQTKQAAGAHLQAVVFDGRPELLQHRQHRRLALAQNLRAAGSRRAPRCGRVDNQWGPPAAGRLEAVKQAQSAGSVSVE